MICELPQNIINKIQSHELYSEDKKIVVSRGKGKPELMFIGEAPGQDENIQGFPFVGRSGKLVDSWINSCGLENYIITNIVPLIPLTDDNKIRKPTAQEIEYFKFFIDYMVEYHKPKYIILLGATACEGYLKQSISQSVFRVFYRDDTKVSAIYHPAFYLRRGENGLDDFKKVYTLLRNQEPRDSNRMDYKQKKLFC